MILFVSDVHGRFDVINTQIDHAERRLGRAVDLVMLPGDLGLFEPHLGDFFRKRGQRFARPFYFIEGNHEDFDDFDRLVVRYADVMTYLPRASLHTFAGQRLLAMGGVAYMDALNTPRGSLLREVDIARCLAHAEGSIDVLVTHDCPMGIGVTNSPVFAHLGPPGFAGSREILERLRPPIWVFGHHHRWFEAAAGGTRFYGLPQGWHGYGVLHDDGRFEFVENHVPRDLSRWDRFKARWLGLP